MAFHSLESVIKSPIPSEVRSVYIVDDEAELLTTLAQSLRAVGFSPRTFDRPDDLLRIPLDDEIGCVISDLRMPGMGGIELIKQLKQRQSCLSVILLTAFADVPTAVDVMKLGATSVIEKPFELNVLVSEINAAMHVSERTFARRKELLNAKSRLDDLSDEEKAVLDLAIEGCPNREIADRLEISPRTVDRRRQSALRKLDADTVAEYAVLKTRVGNSSRLDPAGTPPPRVAKDAQHDTPRHGIP